MSGPAKKRTRRRDATPEPIATVLLRASPENAAHRGAPLPPRAWHDAVGDRIARRTRPIRLERKILTVRAATSVWAQELSFLAPAIVKRLVALGWDIEGLRFCVGAVEPPLRPPNPLPSRSIPPPKPLPRELSLEIARVDDARLRDSIARAAAANLAWQAAASPTSKRPSARGPRSAAPENARPVQTQSTPPGANRRRP